MRVLRPRALVKLVLTLLARDDADVIDASVAFHLNAGADFVIATDHRSTDGTTDILERYEHDGVLHLIREHGLEFDSETLRTRMARLAAEGFAADWVIGADADEFWWPRGGSLKDVLSALPSRFGVVQAPWRFFLPRPDEPSFFAERMTVRLSPGAPLAHPHSAFKPSVKIAHRADARVVVQGGSHRLLAGPFATLPGWHPIEVLHFPTRSPEQLERKMRHWAEAGRDWRFTRAGISGASDFFSSLVLDEDELEAGIETGALTVDTRLRDALRAVRRESPDQGGGQFLLPTGGAALDFPRPAVDDERAYRSELAALGDRSVFRLQRRLDDLSAKLTARE